MAIKSGEVEGSAVTVDPECAIEEWTQHLGIREVFRFLILLWAGPASAMFVASTAILRQPSELSGFQDSMIFSRALFATLSVFTVLVGAIWLVRSTIALPTFRSLGSGVIGWRLHAVGLAGAIAFAPFTFVGGAAQDGIRILVACCALAAGCGLPRWLLTTSLSAAQPLAGFAFCLTLEMTVGWLSWSPESWMGIALLGATTLARSLAVVSCVLASAYALSVGHWPPVVSSATDLAGRIRRVE